MDIFVFIDNRYICAEQYSSCSRCILQGIADDLYRVNDAFFDQIAKFLRPAIETKTWVIGELNSLKGHQGLGCAAGGIEYYLLSGLLTSLDNKFKPCSFHYAAG